MGVCTWVQPCISSQAFQSQPLHSLWYTEYLHGINWRNITSGMCWYMQQQTRIKMLRRCYLHFAYRQSIIDWTMSSLALMEKLIKLVSTRMWYGGPSWVLYWKNRHDGYFVLQEKHMKVKVSWRTYNGLIWYVCGQPTLLSLSMQRDLSSFSLLPLRDLSLFCQRNKNSLYMNLCLWAIGKIRLLIYKHSRLIGNVQNLHPLVFQTNHPLHCSEPLCFLLPLHSHIQTQHS